MPNRNLGEQIRSVQYRREDEEHSFDGLLDDVGNQNSAKYKVVMLPLDRLVEYQDESFEKIAGRPQPFHCYSSEELQSLAQSISEHGVINPITVRPIGNGIYQIVSGRNRARASKLCGMTEIPGIVRTDMDDAKAAMMMLDTNLEQRHHLSYSEKAYAYRMRMELQKQQGKRTDLDVNAERVDSLQEVGKQQNDSRRTVAYLIRLTYLQPELLARVDDGRIGFKVGVELSYLTEETQNTLLKKILCSDVKQIRELRKLESYHALSDENLRNVFHSPKVSHLRTFTISEKTLREYSDILIDPDSIEQLFLEFLQELRMKNLQVG